jgi:hypothetical protein
MFEVNTHYYSLPDHCQPAVSKIDIYVTVVLNVATDIYLISIPAPVSEYNSKRNKACYCKVPL